MAGIKDYSSTATNNTSVGGINIGEGMLPSNINNAIRVSLSVSNTKRQLQSFIRKWSDLYKNKILRVV